MLFNSMFYLISLFSEGVSASSFVLFDDSKAICGMVHEH